MIKSILLGPLISLASLGTVMAQNLPSDMINNADIAKLSSIPNKKKLDAPDPAIIHLQILLDRAGASPGVIDGLDGDNFRKAVSAFETMNGLKAGANFDTAFVERLNDDKRVIAPYVIVPDDVANLVSDIPKNYAEQAKMSNLGYTSAAEGLAEKFHMDIDLLHQLNPGAKFEVGETISVASIGSARVGAVKRLEARRKEGQLVAFGDDGKVLAVYPATIGSEDNPSPSGKHKINGVARNPTYEYNPKINFQQGNNTKKLTLPSGPNNPVGSVWIDLSEPTYGIHGTPEPSLIDKAGSHGCVRLTNWDVEELAAMVKPGVVVEFDK